MNWVGMLQITYSLKYIFILQRAQVPSLCYFSNSRRIKRLKVYPERTAATMGLLRNPRCHRSQDWERQVEKSLSYVPVTWSRRSVWEGVNSTVLPLFTSTQAPRETGHFQGAPQKLPVVLPWKISSFNPTTVGNQIGILRSFTNKQKKSTQRGIIVLYYYLVTVR